MHDDDDDGGGEGVVAREKKESLGSSAKLEPEAEREEEGESRDNLSAFCFRRAKVATRAERGGRRKSHLGPELSGRGAGAGGRQQVSDANRPIKRSKRARCREQDSFHIQTIRSIID
jgi:hypothetical protein